MGMNKPRFSVVRVVLHLSLGLAQALAWLLLWLGASAALLMAFERLTAQRYAPGDAPHSHFQVLTLSDAGAPVLRFLRDWQPGLALATQAPLANAQGDHFFRFTQVEPEVFELRADRDTFISTQRYRVEGQGAAARVTPLHFRWRNVGHGFIAFIAALPLLMFVNKLVRRLLIKKHSKL